MSPGPHGDGLDPDGIVFGADYNPEQWPPDLVAEDVALMRQAGVTRVNLGVFAWSALQPAPGIYDDGWLGAVLDRLDAAGIGVNLATPTASPPPWLLRAHPDVQLEDAHGRRVPPGGRMSWCPSSPVFREHAERIVTHLAQTFGGHPAIRLWHVSNELGNENPQCFCDTCAARFRGWLADRYATVDALNTAWGTAFWGHRYASFGDVAPPRATRNPSDPALALDYRRFCSDSLLAHYRGEAAILRRLTPWLPITTNIMVAQAQAPVDYATWTPHVDVVANDHYTVAADARRHVELALSADRVRGLACGGPWLLMEHSTSAVNWQPRNRAKAPGEMLRDTLAHVARGADGAMFFQWRASVTGSEQYHSAMVPHAGTDTRVWREVVALGRVLRRLAPVRGTRVVPADVALLWDIPSQWAMDAARPPTVDVRYGDVPADVYAALFDAHVAVDVVSAAAAAAEPSILDGRAVVVVPTTYLVTPALSARLEAAARGGAHILVTYLSGIIDATGRVLTGGYPGALRDLLGAWSEELCPMRDGERADLDNGWRASVWSEHVRVLSGTTVVARYASGPLAGLPAVTRRPVGAGTVTYLSCRLDPAGFAALLRDVLDGAGVRPVARAEPGVDVARRVGHGHRYLFCLNHGHRIAHVQASGADLLTGRTVTAPAEVPPGGVLVIDEDVAPSAQKGRS